MMGIMVSMVAGAVLCAFHIMRVRETDRKARAEMQRALREERALHVRDEIRLYDEIMELQKELAEARNSANMAEKAGYRQGRRDRETEQMFIRAYDGQRVKFALTAKEGAR